MTPEISYFVLDTNILLLDATNIYQYNDSVVVLPDIVLKELDSKKTLNNELGFQARETSRILRTLNYTVENKGSYTVAIGTSDLLTVHIVRPSGYPDNAITNDEKIVHVAKLYSEVGATLVTNDTNCYLTALVNKVPSTDLKVVERTEFAFTKRLVLDSSEFASLADADIRKLDPDYAPENYNYVFIEALTGNTKLGVVCNYKVDLIDKTTEDKLRKQDISPIGAEQLFFSYAIQSPASDVVVVNARAGTGKTLVALSNAMALIQQNNLYKQIFYIRASVDDVEKAEEVGFLSGNDEKMAVYFHPLEDALDVIVRQKYKNNKRKGQEFEDFISEQKQNLVAKYNIQKLTGLGMRGRTFHDAILIFDEFQNNSQPSAQKMLTRVGANTKCIIIGSQKQIDNPYITKYNNALSVILDEASKPTDEIRVHGITLHKVVRSKLTDWAETIFSKEIK